MKHIIYFTIMLLIIMGSKKTDAQTKVNMVPITAEMKKETVENLVKMLNENYVFQETAKKMGDYLNSQLINGEYYKITEAVEFGNRLTADLQSISKDKHLNVRFNPETAKMMLEDKKTNKNTDEEDEKRWNESLKKQNYGFKKVEVLPGNIGYIDMTNFAHPKYSKDAIAAAMSFVSNTDAIIFDMRNNGGGDPAGVQMLCSYLFDGEPVHLNDLYYRPKDKTDEYWTLKEVIGKKMPNTPVYILTSNFTFSGAEEFTYNLKNLKRATIVGETTGGGANPGGMMPINENYVVFLPTGTAINPITKTNWEGTGITPDVETAAPIALIRAQILALEDLAEKTNTEEAKYSYKWLAGSLWAQLNKVNLDETTMKSYAGVYGDRTVSFENGKLYYQRTGRPKIEMIPMTEDTFMFNEVGYFRLKVVKDESGNVTEVNGLYDNGDVDRSPRTN